jgi:large repetitive protein
MSKHLTKRSIMCVLLALSAACTVHQDEVPSLIGPSAGVFPAGAPTATFDVSPNPPIPNLPLNFDASGSTPGAGATANVNFTWNFGDGTSTSGASSVVTHAFTAPNKYTVKLTVRNDQGVSSSVTKEISVEAGKEPTADFVFSPVQPVVSQVAQFDASASKAAPGRSIVSYNWNWGDGEFGSRGPTEDHDYGVAGTYTVRLTVTDDLGQTGTVSRSVVVLSGAPTADFSFIVTNAATHTIQVNGSTSSAFGGATILSYSWSWGDGSLPTTSASPIASHSFAAANTYTVILSVIDSAGRTATKAQSVIVP